MSRLLLLFTGILFLSCADSEPQGGAGLYLGGYRKSGGYAAMYWKDGSVAGTYEKPGEILDGTITSIAVHKGMIYLGGSHVVESVDQMHKWSEASWWRNGLQFALPEASSVNTISFAGNDAHMGGNGVNGFFQNLSTNEAYAFHGYWINNETVQIETTPYVGELRIAAIEVEGGDIYIAGSVGGSPAYWKNGVMTALQPDDAVVTGISVSGSDVYLSGNIPAINPIEELGFDKIAVYWKNDVMIRITNNIYNSATSILVEGDNVYITGSDVTDMTITLEEAVVWKNGVPQYIPASTVAYSVIIDNADMHVLCKGNVYWKNHVATVIGDPAREVVTCMTLVK